MHLIQSRLKRVDIYTRESETDGYIGSKVKPVLLGYVYADVQPLSDKLSADMSGKTEKKSARLILRPDAGVKCGDLAAVFSGSPDCEITEVKRFSSHISATAVAL